MRQLAVVGVTVIVMGSLFSCSPQSRLLPLVSKDQALFSTGDNAACVPNTYINLPIFGPVNPAYYNKAQDAEHAMCNAMMYLQDALTFQPAASVTADDRLSNMRSSIYFLTQATQLIAQGFGFESADVRPASYDRYLANMLAEAADLAHMVGHEGMQMAVGMSDAQKANIGSHADLSYATWGRYEQTDYWGGALFADEEGLRAMAHGFLQGWPWRSRASLLSDFSLVAALPSCAESTSDPQSERAYDLLHKYGVPIYTFFGLNYRKTYVWRSPTWDFGETYLINEVNVHRADMGLPALTYADLLSEHELTDEILERAANQLFSEMGIYLKRITTKQWGLITGLVGARNNVEDYQGLMVRSMTGAFHELGLGGDNAAAGAGGVVSVLSRIYDMVKCLTGDSSAAYNQRGCTGLWQSDMPTDSTTQEILSNALSTVSRTAGQRSVLYSQGVVPSTPFLHRIDVTLEGFDSANMSDIKVYSVNVDRGSGIPRFYIALSCLRLGELNNIDCASFLNAAEVCSGESTCVVPLTYDNFYVNEKMIIVADGDKVLDMYMERFMSDVQVISLVFTRHFIDESLLSTYGEYVTKRDARDCSQPYYNSLGLPRNMPIPLENELTSDSDAYEDAYAYYLTRAKEAATDAQNAILRAIDDANNMEAATLRVENQRQDAVDRIEQICGAGQDSCTTPRIPVTTLGDLGVLPGSSGGTPSVCYRPPLDPFIPETLSFDSTLDFMKCDIDNFLIEVGNIKLERLPDFIFWAASSGNLTELSFEDFGGEYKLTLLELQTALVDLRSAAATAKTTIKKLPDIIESERLSIQALQLDTLAIVLEGIASACNSANPGGGIFSAMAAGVRAVSNQLRVAAAVHDFTALITDQMGQVEQTMLGLERAAIAMKVAIEKLDMLELEQSQAKDRAERLGAADLAQYVGSGPGNQMKAFRKLTLVSNLKALRAVRRAKKMSFIARRAVELKLAVDLTQEKAMPIIGEPPAKWVDDLYNMYQSEEIYDDNSSTYTYVQRLEDYVYNYPFQYGFADGQDTAVLSMRDDLLSLGENCITVENVKNLVSYSEEIERWSFTPASGLVTPDIEQSPLGPEMTADFVTVDCGPACAMLSSEEYPVGDTPASAYAGSIYVAMLESDDTMELRLRAEYRCYNDWSTVLDTRVGEGMVVAYQEGQTWQRVGFYIDGLPDLTSIICANDDPVLTLQIEAAFVDNDESKDAAAYLWGAQIEAVPSGVVPRYGPDVVIDGDMELKGVSAWTPGNAAKLDKFMNGHLGTRSLSVKGYDKAYAAQSGILVPGATYRITGWAYSNDNASPAIGISSEYDLLWIGEPKPYWQLFDKAFVAASDSFYLLVWEVNGKVAFDDIVIQQVPQGTAFTEYEPAPLYGTHADCITVTVQDPWSTDPEDTIELTYYDPILRQQRLLASFSAKCVNDDQAILGQTPAECSTPEKGGVDYMERTFSITMEAIESGDIVDQGQISGGNYNYRIKDIAINLVGSNIKDCSLDPGAGTTCYINQFIPYDFVQAGAVKVRNHAGVALPFELSVGRIHQAKGLAAERLLTNPLSSTDSALIQQYRKDEFRGRPIQGDYTLRIHAVPSLRWTNIEDVQILLGYRYWSASSSP